jgi:cytochrome b6-f complex iron-sulfur subunit
MTRTRRTFCAQGCKTVSLAAFGGALSSLLQGCNPFTYPTPVEALKTLHGTESNGTVVITVDSSSPLAATGGAALVQASTGPILVVRTGAGSFTALNGTCTHRVCTITGFINSTFVCPCHGSEFSTSGHVVNGPASVDLVEHHTQFTDPLLAIGL